MGRPEIRKEMVTLSARRQQCENELLAFRHSMAKGSLYSQYTSCAKAGCRCMNGQKHGPFYYLSFKEEGRSRVQYIGKLVPPRLAKQLERYREFGKRLHELRKLDRSLTELWNQFREGLIVERG